MDNLKIKGAQDRSKINMHEPHEVQYWTKHLKVSKEQLQKAGDKVGNAAAAGPVGRPLLSGFYSTFTAIVPQGSGVSLLRSVSYFGGHGAQTPLVTLTMWGAAGCLLAIVATASRVNYRAVYERIAGRDRAILRPGLLSPAD